MTVKHRDPDFNSSLNVLACVGNEARVISGAAKGAKGTVCGTHGGVEHVIVDFAGLPAGTEVVLTNSAPAPWPGNPGVGVIPEVMKFIVQDSPGHTDPVPAALRPTARWLAICFARAT